MGFLSHSVLLFGNNSWVNHIAVNWCSREGVLLRAGITGSALGNPFCLTDCLMVCLWYVGVHSTCWLIERSGLLVLGEVWSSRDVQHSSWARVSREIGWIIILLYVFNGGAWLMLISCYVDVVLVFRWLLYVFLLYSFFFFSWGDSMNVTSFRIHDDQVELLDTLCGQLRCSRSFLFAS